MNYWPWNIIFLFGFIIYVYIRHCYDGPARATEKVVKCGGTWDIALLILVAIGTAILPLLYLFTPLISFADYHLPLWVHCVGVVVMILALWLFWRAHADLGVNWSVTLELRKDHQLVTRGVYGLIRHPMYAAIFLFSLAQGLLLNNLLAGWSALVTFAVMYFVRVSREEAMMLAQFGQGYQDYIERTGRVFPRLR